MASATALCTTGTTEGGGKIWLNPDRISADDGSYATAGCTNLDIQTAILRGVNYSGLSTIPVGATIDGIEVIMELSGPGSGNFNIQYVTMIKSLAAVGTPKTPFESVAPTDTYYTFGDPSDLWDTTWTRDEIIAATTGFEMNVGCLVSSGTRTLSCDAFYMTVYYTEGGGDGTGAVVRSAVNQWSRIILGV